MASNNAPGTSPSPVNELVRGVSDLSLNTGEAIASASTPSSSGTQSPSEKPYEWFKNHPWANEAPPKGELPIKNIEPHTR